MDDLVKRAIGLAEQKTKAVSSVPWRTDEPFRQPWHVYDPNERRWVAVTADTPRKTSSVQTTKVALYSWNIDFMLPFPDSRMGAAIRHLERLVQVENAEDTAFVVFLQECLESDLELLTRDDWIQQTFAITDVSSDNWQNGHYGTTTLVDRSLNVKGVFRVHYEQTRMQRDGLFADVALPSDNTPAPGQEARTIRLCNTHLESLALAPPLRPAQMALCASYMKANGFFAAAAGDFNAIQDLDRSLHTDNELKDAYLETGGAENDAANGHTWGQQAATTQRERFGTSRMDKVFFCGEAMRCVGFERIGAGVEVQDEDERKSLESLGFDKPWITDHLGVKAVFEVV